MAHPFGMLRLICNPRSGHGRVGKLLPQLRAHLDRAGIAYDVALTTGPRSAEALARQAVAAGIRYIAAVGGDGTVHEVVNGLLDSDGTPLHDDTVLAVVSAGSGGDFARTFGLDRSPQMLVDRHLATAHTMPLDVGVVTFHDRDGRERRRFFANIAEVGWGAEVVRRAARLPRFIGRPRYLLAAWGAIRAAPRQEATITLAHTVVTVPLVELVVANGQFFGGGMKVAPRALPDDGKFNVLAFTGGASQVFLLTPKMYQGEHLPHPDIAEWQSATVALDAAEPMLVEADGEVLGHTPATFAVVDRPLTLKI